MGIRLLIIGGVAGGATAAARARRVDEHAEIILFERGEYISFANCGLPYYIGDVIRRRDDLLVTTPQALRDRYRIDIRVLHEVVSIDRGRRQVHVRDIATGRTYDESYDRIILSPGAEPFRPDIEGFDDERVFSLRNIPDSDRIKALVDRNRPRDAVVIGGGFIGIEMAENLAQRGVKTTILEMLDQVMPQLDYEMAGLVHAHLRDRGVALMLGEGLKSFAKEDGRLIVNTTKGRSVTCDLAILSVGIRPENRLAREAELILSERGHIVVDQTMATSDPTIYAIGDAVSVRDYLLGLPVNTALAGPANKQGRIAADNALGRRSLFTGTLGTSIAKIFDLTAASTGMNEKALKAAKVPHLVSYTHSGSHASYYPGAETLSIKLVFTPGTGRLLGAQVVGGEGSDKRIDVLATAIHGRTSVFDLEELELAYAPPYSSAKDPVNMAGFVAANMIKGDVATITWDELSKIDRGSHVLIDLRNRDELRVSGVIEGAVHIPLNELRERLDELDRTKTMIPFCAAGLRGYIAHRILVQHGFRSRNLSGGYRTWLGARERIMEESGETRLWLGE
ncbi:MAG TPA: FAD-dependent oxidoreductase [Deltaproteobacteria bacterium]|nr:FAD-dependent oxidoreductase [Deltaproteobacteria bacterium]HXK47904.1 FAD-dependent oxidoreductase [Deltaproteobacteria bacterium]